MTLGWSAQLNPVERRIYGACLTGFGLVRVLQSTILMVALVLSWLHTAFREGMQEAGRSGSGRSGSGK